MATIENFILRFKTEGVAGISSLADSIKKAGANTGALGSGLDLVGGKLGVVGGLAFGAAGAFVSLGLKAINVADTFGDLSSATGIAAGQLVNLKQSMILGGGSAESFEKAATKLSIAVGEAGMGNAKYQKSFKDLGVFVTDASGKMRNTGDILQDVIRKLAQIEDPATRAATAVALMGKEAAKIDWTKVNAINDPFKDAQIEQLGKYRDALDAIANAAETRLLTVFGGLALKIKEAEDAGDRAAKRQSDKEEALAKKGQRPMNLQEQLSFPFTHLRTTPPQSVPMSTKELEAYRLKTMEEAMKPYGNSTRADTSKGGYGGPPEASIKAAAESEKRILESQAEVRKQIAIRSGNELKIINATATADIAKATADINAKEDISPEQKAKEIAAKVTEVRAKQTTDIAKFERDSDEKYRKDRYDAVMRMIDNETQAEIDAIKARDDARSQLKSQDESFSRGTDSLKGQFALQQQIVGLSAIEQQRLTDLFNLEELRKSTLLDISNIKDLPNDERLAAEQRLNVEIGKRKGLIEAEAAAQKQRNLDFSAGFKETMDRYLESMSPLRQGEDMANSIFSNMGSAVDNFVDKGGKSFADFADSVVRDLIKIALKAQVTQLFTNLAGAGSDLLSQGLSFLSGSRAGGGGVSAGGAYLVGENGPEIFMPAGSGTIASNSQLNSGGGNNTAVTYNIQAVDAASFKQMIARDPSFLYAVTQQGAKSVPTTRR